MKLTKEQDEMISTIFASSDHTGESIVDIGFQLEIIFKRLNQLEETLKAKNPVCPHCLVEMKKVFYQGYYDERSYWQCDCDFKNDVDVIKDTGCYA